MAENIVDPYADDPYAAPAVGTDDGLVINREQRSRRVSPFAIVIVLAAVLLSGVVIWGVIQSQKDTITEGPAPDFELTMYDSGNIEYTDPDLEMDLSGQTVSLSSFEGEKVVVVNFWNSTCVPCRQEAPMLVQVYEDYRDQGVILIGINAKDPDRLAHEYLAEYDITYPNGLDLGDRIQGQYRTTGYPETYIIDREGNIQRHFAGPPSERELRTEIEKALGNS